jgi:FSR family fosmidomycin resistance protein-like MFS transporter
VTEIAEDVPMGSANPAVPAPSYGTPTDATAAAVPVLDYAPPAAANATVLGVLLALSFSHMLNDTIQALLPAIYPLLKRDHGLSYADIGLITFTFQLTASLLQPLVGTYTDKRPKPYSLAIGMGFTLIGLLLLSRAHDLHAILLAAGLVGTGSSVFHPEASRLAHLAAGGRHGFAQSLFQVGGNFGSSLGPLLAAAVIVPWGQPAVAWFSILALLGIIVLARIGAWYAGKIRSGAVKAKKRAAVAGAVKLSPRRVTFAILVLVVLIVSKYFYLVSLSNYYTFYLIHKFGLTVTEAQLGLFAFLFAVAAGTIAGGPLGDRFGRKLVIWASILGVAPFSLVLPHVGLPATVVMSVFAGVILASAFSAILVYAQELLPGRVGMVAGLFFGFAFGVAGVASAALGKLADARGIEYVFQVCAYLPLIGLITVFLPNNVGRPKRAAAA